jgi:glycosyltransferase involved in cell wall biosynthesis
VGRLTPSKGVHVFTAAFTHLNGVGGFAGQIWGDPNQEPDYVKSLAATYPASAPLTFKGKFARPDIAAVYSGLDVLVVPSIWYENNPLVIQEAFAAGVPVIASNLGGMAEFVKHEVNGLLFKAGDADDLARTMRRLLTEPDLLEQLRRNLPPVKSVAVEADELLAYYTALTVVHPTH